MTNMTNLAKKLNEWVESNEVDVGSISLGVDVNDDGEPWQEGDGDRYESEGYFGSCDITGERGEVFPCSACDEKGNIFYFDALSTLITGPLGSLAGAF